MNTNRTGLLLGVKIIAGKRLDVPVKDESNNLFVFVDDRTARVSSDDVSRIDEVHRRFGIQLVLACMVSGWQFIVAFGTV